MRIEEEAVGSIPLRLNGQYGSRVNQVCTLLNCKHYLIVHTVNCVLHYLIVLTTELGSLLNCAHFRNWPTAELCTLLNSQFGSRITLKCSQPFPLFAQIHTIMHERCM